jgi:beta-xylosidase
MKSKQKYFGSEEKVEINFKIVFPQQKKGVTIHKNKKCFVHLKISIDIFSFPNVCILALFVNKIF